MKHLLSSLFIIYVIVHAPLNDYSMSYSDDKVDIAKIVSFPFDIVDKATYDSFVKAHTIVRTPDPVRDALKAQARQDIKNQLLSAPQRLQALLILLDFDL